MEITFTVKELLLYLVSLFSIFSPFAVIGPYTALTQDFSSGVRNRIAFRVGVFTMINLILIAWLGNVILDILGISLASLRCAGGLVLILASLPMIRKGSSPRRKVDHEMVSSDEGWQSIIVTPLIFPITMGAGTIALVITQAGQAVTIGDKLALNVIILLHGMLVFSTYFFSGPVLKKIGTQGNDVITRIGGIILLSLAFMIFTDGLKELLPGLG
ncbi:MAG: MarC family protein [Spirochaetales bacterium]|nr:MarC family protein [Spirochaetales bacterium]